MGTLFRRILKLDSPITVGDWIYQRLTNNWHWLVAAFSGAGMTYFATVSDWLRPWGPVGWAAIGVVFSLAIGLSVTAIYWLYASAALRLQQSKATKSMAESVKGVNPLRDTFENERISISDFYSPLQIMYKRKTFRKCDIFGPGALVFHSRTTVLSPSIYRSDFIVIGEGSFASPVAFEESSFYECRFYGVTILLNQEMAKAIDGSNLREGSSKPEFHGAPVP